jgi:ATP-dependent Clp protease protease subunit
MKEPIRCFEGNAKPHEPFWHFVDAAEGGDPILELNGVISEYSWFDDDISPKMFKDDLYKYGKGGPISIHLHSYGGDPIAANVMKTIIQDYPGKVTVRVDGIAASAATIVAMAADKLTMQEGAYFMIHDPSVAFFMAQLNIEEMTRMVDSLKTIKSGIMDAYETKTGMSRARLSKMMTDETWMTAGEAVAMGFADEIAVPAPKIAPLETIQPAAYSNMLRNYANVPPALLSNELAAADAVEVEEAQTPEPSEPIDAREVKRLRDYLDIFA